MFPRYDARDHKCGKIAYGESHDSQICWSGLIINNTESSRSKCQRPVIRLREVLSAKRDNLVTCSCVTLTLGENIHRW